MDIPTSSPPEEQETNWPETLRSFEVTDSVTSENSLVEIHKACREKFESLIGIVIGYAKTQFPEIQSVLDVIAQDVDDQRVRFEIWTSDTDADEEYSLSSEALGDEQKRDFELVKNTLLTILSCLRDVSKDVIEKLITFETETPEAVISTPAHFAETITELGSLIKTLFDLVPPILAINCLRKQEGPYWAQRQKVLEVRNSAVRLDTQTTLVSSKPEHQTNVAIISRTQTPLVSSKQKSNAFAGTPSIKVSLSSGIFEIEKENTSMGEIEDVVMSPGSDAQMNDPTSDIEKFSYEFEVKEQDRWLPIANVSRIMKAAIPENAKIAKDAKECMQECVSEFVSFITSEALEKTQQEKRKTINGEDILFAMASLGFENYAEALQIYLFKYRESAVSTRRELGVKSVETKE